MIRETIQTITGKDYVSDEFIDHFVRTQWGTLTTFIRKDDRKELSELREKYIKAGNHIQLLCEALSKINRGEGDTKRIIAETLDQIL